MEKGEARINGVPGGFPGSRGGPERCCLICGTVFGVIMLVLGGCAWLMLGPVLYNGVIDQNFVTAPVRTRAHTPVRERGRGWKPWPAGMRLERHMQIHRQQAVTDARPRWRRP
jgi:hypothetical protein